MGYVYLASPYTGTATERRERFVAVCRAAAQLMQEGSVVYSPIAHGHVIAQYMDDNQSHEFWIDQCIPILRRAERLIVLCLPGWDSSLGVGLEIQFAKNNNIPILALHPEEN